MTDNYKPSNNTENRRFSFITLITKNYKDKTKPQISQNKLTDHDPASKC